MIGLLCAVSNTCTSRSTMSTTRTSCHTSREATPSSTRRSSTRMTLPLRMDLPHPCRAGFSCTGRYCIFFTLSSTWSPFACPQSVQRRPCLPGSGFKPSSFMVGFETRPSPQPPKSNRSRSTMCETITPSHVIGEPEPYF
jgi:hypothetical protein